MKNPFISKFLMPCAVLISSLICSTTHAQNTDKQEKENARIDALKKAIEGKHYVFTAQNATTMGGRTRQLTALYQLRVKGDTVDSDLPYYGRAYTSTIGSTEGGIVFKTSDLAYNSKDGSKGGWDIMIEPKGVRDVQRMTLSISNSGYGSLQVTSNTRQMISFYGHVEELK